MKKQLQTNGILFPLFTLALMLVSLMGVAQTAYITNDYDNTVSVINVITNRVIDTIAVAINPYGVSVTSDGSKVYIASQYLVPGTIGGDSGFVSVINTATNTVSATIRVAPVPYGISVSHDGSKVYVASYGKVSVINASADTVSAIIAIDSSAEIGIVVSPDGNKVYVANDIDSTVSVINTGNDSISAIIRVGATPQGISVTPDGSKVYVANFVSNTIKVINTATNTVSDTITVGANPFGMAVTPDGSKLYVANYGDSSVSVINIAVDTILATVAVGREPEGISVSPDGSKVCVANNRNNTINVINTTTNTVTDTITVGNGPVSFGNFISSHTVAGLPAYSIDASSISIYPNPATNKLTIHTSFTGAATVSIINVLGQEAPTPTSLQLERGDVTLDVSRLDAGVYFLQLKSERGSAAKMFVKE